MSQKALNLGLSAANHSPDQLTVYPLSPGARFCAAIAMGVDGLKLVVGAPGEYDGAGAVYVYSRSVGQPFSETTPVRLTVIGSLGFGSAVSLDGDQLVVGAPDSDDAKGAVYIFDISSSEPGVSEPVPWENFIKPETLASGDRFGASVEVQDDRLFVGSPGDDVWGHESGSIYEFGHQSGWYFKKRWGHGELAYSGNLGRDLALMEWQVSGLGFERYLVAGGPSSENDLQTSGVYVFGVDNDLQFPLCDSSRACICVDGATGGTL